MKKTVDINKKIAKQLQKWLELNEPIPDTGPYEVVATFTADFGNNIEADIKVCNSDLGGWIDAVLFDEGHEVCTIEPSYELLGDFHFEYDGKRYIAVLKEK